MDDVLFPGATAGTLYVSDTGSNQVYAVHLTGLNPNTPIVALGSFDEVALVNPVTGVVGEPLLTGLTAVHGLDFVVTPEPSTWALLLLAGAVVAHRASRRRFGAASRPAAAT